MHGCQHAQLPGGTIFVVQTHQPPACAEHAAIQRSIPCPLLPWLLSPPTAVLIMMLPINLNLYTIVL